MAEISEVNSSVSEISPEEQKVLDEQNKLSQKVELTVGDLKIFVNIIEATTQRGAFRAPELKGIGEFFEKISALIPKETPQ
jgi:hypothetical protein|tara:strand:+ start:1575 stop:1817 length:243 start_codon:yes stop_codon:yes gene_type:complete